LLDVKRLDLILGQRMQRLVDEGADRVLDSCEPFVEGARLVEPREHLGVYVLARQAVGGVLLEHDVG